MKVCLAILLHALALFLLVFAHANAHCEGTIAFRTQEGKIGIVAVQDDQSLASPEYFDFPFALRPSTQEEMSYVALWNSRLHFGALTGHLVLQKTIGRGLCLP